MNLGSCVFNFKLPMLFYERGIMAITFVIVASIEITIAVTKPSAAVFAGIVLCLGFAARAMHKGFNFSLPKPAGRIAALLFPAVAAEHAASETVEMRENALERHLGPERPVTAIMVSSRGVAPTLRFAVEEARHHGAILFVLFVREVYTTIPVAQREEDDVEAHAVFNAVKAIAGDVEMTTIYAVSDDPSWTILDNAAIAGVDMLILGHSRRMALTRLLRGDLFHTIGMHLPEEIRLVIVG